MFQKAILVFGMFLRDMLITMLQYGKYPCTEFAKNIFLDNAGGLYEIIRGNPILFCKGIVGWGMLFENRK